MTTSSRTCPYCSAPVSAQAFFCPSCGRVMDAEAPAAESAAALQDFGRAERPLEQKPLEQVPLNQGTADFGTPPVPPPPYSTPPGAAAAPPRRGATGWIIAAVAGVLLLCCLCLCLFAVAWGVLALNSGRTTYDNQPFPMIVTEQVQPKPPFYEVTPGFETPQPDESLPKIIPIPEQIEPVMPTEGAMPGDFQEFSGTTAQFAYPAGLASAIREEQVPENTDSNSPYWQIVPAHSEYFLEGYPVTGHMHEAQIFVYPVDDFARIYPDSQAVVDDLQRLLNERPDLPPGDGPLPFMPFWNAAQVLHSGARYIDGDGVSGIRYLTQFGQDIGPVASDRIFYTFQGLSDDGQYYIAAVMPVSSPAFPNSDKFSAEAVQQIAENYENYLKMSAAMLDAMPGESFTPPLGQLDALVQSFRAGPRQ